MFVLLGVTVPCAFTTTSVSPWGNLGGTKTSPRSRLSQQDPELWGIPEQLKRPRLLPQAKPTLVCGLSASYSPSCMAVAILFMVAMRMLQDCRRHS